jgi:hypothetical protein
LIDFGFIVQRSSNTERLSRLQGANGETCYCLIVDHFSGTLYGETFCSKKPPIDFLNRWLARHGHPHDEPDTYVRFDLGGELGSSNKVVKLFEDAGYSVEPTAPASSSQNGPGERPHQTIANGMRALLDGAGLKPMFWPYAFQHYLWLYNMTPHGDAKASPFEICTGNKPDLRYLRVFGCQVYVIPPRPRRPSTTLEHAPSTGIFLGYTETSKNIIYYDIKSKEFKTAQHVGFNEAMNGIDSPSPNAQLLCDVRTPSDAAAREQI